MEKVDVVKRLIRSHNYQDTEKVYLRCLELGIHVNKTALRRFSQKLSLLDKANRLSNKLPNLDTIDIPPRQKVADPFQLSSEQSKDHLVSLNSATAEQGNKQDSLKTSAANAGVPDKPMSFSEAKRREAEITFELGALKIKEHALLEELNTLAKITDEKH